MANRYQDERPRRDRFQDSYGRQEEQFEAYRGFGDDRYGQMGDSWRDYDDPDTGWRRERGFGREERFGSGSRDSWRERENRGYESARFRDRDRPATYRSFSDATASGAGTQLAANHGEWREPSREYSDYRGTWGGFGGRDTRSHGRDRDDDRGFLERAGDTLAHWLGDDADYRRGERGYRGRGPANYTRSDERIREDACDRLTEDWRVDASQIEIRVENGEVTLDGTVSSREQKRRAEDCVEDLSGVRHVQNNLRVRDESWTEPRGSRSSPTTTQA